MRALRLALFFCCLALLGGKAALAHKGSDAYLDVQQTADAEQGAAAGSVTQRSFRFVLAVAIKDLDQLVPIDANADAKVTWGEVKAAMPVVLELLNASANIELPPGPGGASDGLTSACRLRWQPDGIEQRGDGAYIRSAAQARCPADRPLSFRYILFKDQDSTHRLLVAGRVANTDLLTTVSPQQQAALLLSPGAGAAANAHPYDRWSTLRDYFRLGVHHLLEGYDHLAFLLALVLPLRLDLRRGWGKTLPAASTAMTETPGQAGPRRVWLALLQTVTAFTLGHSITLMLATFGWTQASPVWVEPAIALSIVLTALLNLRPVPWIRTDVLALGFGMIHGFGFAGLLKEAAAPGGLLPWALAGFNVGVEAGQLIAVSGWVLISQAVVARSWYPRVVVRGGSVLLVLLAAFWFWQRVG
jgi:HupE / UreJ protein